MRFLLFLTLSFSGFWLKGQSLSQTYDLAQQKSVEKNYDLASSLFQRVLFFDSLGEYAPKVYPQIAQAYYANLQYREAIAFFDLAQNLSQDPITKNEYQIKKISSYLLLKDYAYAELELFNLDSIALNQEQHKELKLLKAITYFAKEDFPQSEFYFKSISGDSSKVKSLFKKNQKISKISPKRAQIMSMIIPGLGQLYVGDIKNGLNSLVLTGGLMALGIRGAIINNPLDAFLSTMPWFQRYYKGGYTKAETIAIEKIKEKRYKVYNQLLDTVNIGH
jgi:tetratricopeptide (TPR) repeat protein